MDVRFKNQGLECIEVQDNGSGISPDNYETIALKHYTSKLATFSDMDTLVTFGFRGEALSSLSALSNLSITTCIAEDVPKASKLEFGHSGKLAGTSIVAGQKGTIVTVQNLFHNLPVRRRELERNIKREWNKAVALLNQYASIRTGLKFTVSQQPSKGKRIVLFATKGNITTRDNIINIFGTKTITALIELDVHLEFQPTLTSRTSQRKGSTYVRCQGFVSRPSQGEGRQTPDRQMFFVNGRPCVMPQFSKIFNETYRQYNPSQSPFVLADIRLDTHLYDVNVSPDKRTILMHEQGPMLEELRGALLQLFEEQDYSLPKSQLSKPTTNSHSVPKTTSPSKTSYPTADPVPDDGGEMSSSDVAEEATSLRETPSVLKGTQSRRSLVRNPLSASSSTTRAGLAQSFMNRWMATSSDHPQGSSSFSYTQPETTEATARVGPMAISSPTQEAASLIDEDSGVDDDHPELSTIQPKPALAIATLKAAARDTNDAPDEVEEEVSRGCDTLTAGMPQPSVSSIGAESRSLAQNGNAFQETKYPSHNTRQIRPSSVRKSQRSVNNRSNRDRLQSPTWQARFSAQDCRAAPAECHTAEHVPSSAGASSETAEAPRTNKGGFHDFGPTDEACISSSAEVENAHHQPPTGSGSSSRSASPSIGCSDIAELADQSDLPTVVVSDSVHAVIDKNQSQRTEKGKYATLHLSQCTEIDAAAIRDAAADTHRRAESLREISHPGSIGQGIEADNAEETLSLIVTKTDFTKMTMVGQFNLGFILAMRHATPTDGQAQKSSSEDQLFIIDQHASDEKYNFERLQAETVLQSQRLVHPKRLELTALEEEIVKENIPALELNGFQVRIDESGSYPVGSRCELVALPLSRETTFALSDLEELISLLGDDANSAAGQVPRPSKVRKLFAMRACRSSIMIGKALTRQQMESLVRHMGQLDKPWNCPHGRPTMRHLCGLQDWNARGWQEDDISPRRVNWARYSGGGRE